MKIHVKIIHTLLMAPLNEFFDRVPMGRILNKLSKDLYIIDQQMPYIICVIFVVIYALFIELGLCVYAIQYWVVIPFIVMLVLMLKIQQIYMRCNTELIRLEAVSKSPIVSFYTETLGGLPTIRSFGQSILFLHEHAKNINENIRVRTTKLAFDEWFLQRITFLSLILVVPVSALTLFWGFGGSFAGLLLYYLFQIEIDLRDFISYISSAESMMVTFERCHALGKIPPEKGYLTNEINNKMIFSPENIKNSLENWPSEGKIEFRNISIKYRPDLDIVLKNLNIIINPKEKIGVVGRTGAGKSTLILSMLRILEPCIGEILIDNIGISKFDLRDLRKKITVIPQDIYLFEGSLKTNLDPNNEFEEDFIWDCLGNVGLKELFETKDGLKFAIEEQGKNLSSGEKQLISLCKAFLKKNKIILIDEATANVDLKTDLKIQEVIREKFKEFTVVTIAHRINTILNNDRILVLDKGLVKEFDKPDVLIQNKESLFFKMWQNSQNGTSII